MCSPQDTFTTWVTISRGVHSFSRATGLGGLSPPAAAVAAGMFVGWLRPSAPLTAAFGLELA